MKVGANVHVDVVRDVNVGIALKDQLLNEK